MRRTLVARDPDGVFHVGGFTVAESIESGACPSCKLDVRMATIDVGERSAFAHLSPVCDYFSDANEFTVLIERKAAA